MRVTPSSGGSAAGDLRAIAEFLRPQVDRLLAEHCVLVRNDVESYQSGGLVSAEDLRTSCQSQVTYLLEVMGSGEADVEAPRRVGRLRAEQGVPLTDVMSAYRVGSRFWWEQIRHAIEQVGGTVDSVLDINSALWQYQDEYTEAMATAYREVATTRLIHRQQTRGAVVGGLLNGRLPADLSPWDAARLLGLPRSKHFVAAAVRVDARDLSAPRAENMLDAAGFQSAWQIEPDAQVGLVAVSAPEQLASLQRALRHNETHRSGLSPLYDGLPPTGEAIRYARTALSATTETQRVVAFDDNPYAVAAISDPQTMARYAHTVLGTLADLDVTDKTMLLDTFRQWVASGGSVTVAAEALFCHPNTVRYRLRRLKEHTGRDVALPGDIAELCLAVEAEHRMHPLNG